MKEVQRYKLPAMREITPGAVMYTMVAVVNNIVHLKIVTDLKSSHHKKKNRKLCVLMDVTILILVIISQYVHISSHYVVYLKLMQCYMLIISQLKNKEILASMAQWLSMDL